MLQDIDCEVDELPKLFMVCSMIWCVPTKLTIVIDPRTGPRRDST